MFSKSADITAVFVVVACVCIYICISGILPSRRGERRGEIEGKAAKIRAGSLKRLLYIFALRGRSWSRSAKN